MKPSFVTIVSGLPRSGTSMMMQALEAGGIPILSDRIRTKDADNPKGYYEFEPVKQTKLDPSWVARATGKAVKVIYRLVYDLPDGYDYRVIFIQRNIAEILASQKKMLARSGKQGARVSDEKLISLFEKQLSDFHRWISTQAHFSTLIVNHKDVIRYPETVSREIKTFIGNDFDARAAAAVVDPSLYRNRSDRIKKLDSN